jgi:hypothetical protein
VTDTWDHGTRLDSYRRLAKVAGAVDAQPLAVSSVNTCFGEVGIG